MDHSYVNALFKRTRADLKESEAFSDAQLSALTDMLDSIQYAVLEAGDG